MTEKAQKASLKGFWPFALGGLGFIIALQLTGQLSYALTDSYGMSAMLVGTILLVSRIFDGISDLVAGVLIDKTNTRWGKARPFDLCIIPLWIFVVLSFSVPNLSQVGKVVWVFLTFNMTQTVFYTLLNSATVVRLRRSFREDVHVQVNAYASALIALAALLVSVVTPLLISAFDGDPHAWTYISLIYAIPSCILGMAKFFMLKELPPSGEQQATASYKIKTGEAVKLLFKNKYIFILGAVVLFANFAANITGAVQLYYFNYVVGNVTVLSLVSLLGVAGMMFIVFMPRFTKKFGYKNTLLAGLAMLALGCVLRNFSPASFIWLAVCNILCVVGNIFLQGMKSLMAIDCMEYGIQQTGVELEGLYGAVVNVVDKLAVAVSSFIVGALLEFSGYNGALAVQSAKTISMVNALYTYIPACFAAVAILIAFAYNLDKKMLKANAPEEVNGV